jgi:hypothetical protein
MYARLTVFPEIVLIDTKAPSGTLYAVPDTGDLHRHQSSHPLLAPMTGASLLMSLSAYNTAGIGMLSTVFSLITGTVGLWGLWTVRLIISSRVIVPNTMFIKIAFAGSGRRSKLGADKRTSAFIFANKSAASEIKKSAKKQS